MSASSSLPEASGILSVCPKAPVHTHPAHTFTPRRVSNEPAPTHMLSMPPHPPGRPGQSQILLVWNSRFHPLFSARPPLQGLKSCHSSPKLQELLLPRFHSPCPHPSQGPSSCCRECPSPSLAWQRFPRGVRGWRRGYFLVGEEGAQPSPASAGPLPSFPGSSPGP